MSSRKAEELNRLDRGELLTLARRVTDAPIGRQTTQADLMRLVMQSLSTEQIRSEVRQIARQRGTRWERRLASRRFILGSMVLTILVSSFYVAWLGSTPNQFYLVESWNRTVPEDHPNKSLAGAVDETGSLCVIEVNTDGLLVKYTSRGVEEWRRNFTMVGYQLMGRPWQPSLTIDEDSRSIYVAGVCSDPAVAVMKGFVAGLDWQGEVRWTQTWSSGSKAEQVIAGEGAVCAVGSMNTPSGERAFLVRYDADGNHVWNATLSGNAPALAEGVAVDDDGNVFVTGYFNGSSMPSETVYYGFLSKYDAAGDEVWNTTWSGFFGSHVIVSGGYAYVAGSGLGKHNSENGMLAWRRELSYLRGWSYDGVSIIENFNMHAYSIGADGSILAAGWSNRGEMNGTYGTWTRSHAVILAMLDSNGTMTMNATSTRQPGSLFVDAIVVRSDGRVWVVGRIFYEPGYYWEFVLMQLRVMSSFLAGTALTVSSASVACVTLAILWKEKQANLRNSRRR